MLASASSATSRSGQRFWRRLSLGTGVESRYEASRRSPRRTGFTLPEILIVVVLISVAAMIALPRFSQANARRHLNSAHMRFLSAAATARQAAIQKGAKVRFSWENDSLTVTSGGTNLMSPAPIKTLYKVEVSAVPNIDHIDYDGRGFANPALSGTGATVTLSRSDVGSKTVSISRLGMAQ